MKQQPGTKHYFSSWLFLQVARYTGSRETSGNRRAVVYALRESLIGDSSGYVK
jgi:hypothetical protein